MCPAALPGTPEALKIVHERITGVGAGESKTSPWQFGRKLHRQQRCNAEERGRSEDKHSTAGGEEACDNTSNPKHINPDNISDCT